MRARGLLKDFATDQLRRGRFKPYPHPTYDNTSIVEGDADDYDFLRGTSQVCMRIRVSAVS